MNAKFWLGKLKGRDHLKDLDIHERIILECILKGVNWKCMA
jgi:hypothetical protein